MLNKFVGNEFRRTPCAKTQRDAINFRASGLKSMGAPAVTEKLENLPTPQLWNDVLPQP